LADLLDRVASGEEITITRHGVPVAKLVPVTGNRKDVRMIVDTLLEFRRGLSLGGLSLRDMIEEGRR
jgi:antitoxin (DNA-binding transcriptional repressor) of toxin-antitoxin stability system